MKTKVQGETKQGMKRKLEKVEQKVIKTKVPLKADVIIQLKELEEKYKELEAKNQKYLEKIEVLQERIKAFEAEKQTMTNYTQTESGFELKCSECNFEASSDSEFNWHMGKIHGWSHEQSSDDLDSSIGIRDCRRCEYQAEDKYDLDGHIWTEHEEDEDGKITCKFCDQIFANVANLMKHKKVKHREKVAFCQHFNAGGCPFNDIKCWFLHIRNNETFECNICNETFKSKTNFMHHRKLEHSEMVQICKNNEYCVFKRSCWFKHEHIDKKISKEKTDDNEHTGQKLIGTVENSNKEVSSIEKMTINM